MGGSIPSPIFGAFIAAMLVAVVLSVLAWRWAVRTPLLSTMHDSPALSPQKAFVYAAIGASDVVGVGAANPSTESWVNVVHSLMPPGTELVRLGRSGITLKEANTLEVPRAVEAKPDLVTIWNCVNDAVRITPLDLYNAELRKALTLLTRQTGANILVLNLPDLSLLVQYSGYAAQRDLVRAGVEQWNRAMLQTVKSFGDRVAILDLFDLSHEVELHPEYISRDNFHPSSLGYKRLGDYVWATLYEKGWVPVPSGRSGQGEEEVSA